MILGITIGICFAVVVYYLFIKPNPKDQFKNQLFPEDAALMELGKVREQLRSTEKDNAYWRQEAINNVHLYEEEKKRNEIVISQKKSSETRLGQVTEHIVPFLEDCRHDPKNMHFMGQPIDYLVFDFDQGEITFLEVKTGNAQESKRQKMIKNIIKAGKVYYETMRVNTKGVIVKTQENQP